MSKDLDQLIFDPFRFAVNHGNDIPLCVAGRHIFRCHGLDSLLDLDYKALDKLMKRIDEMMLDNGYHNKLHVLDVLQSVHALLLTDRLATLIPPEMKVATLLAACIHDLEHRGVSNDFLVKTCDDWAKEAGDDGANEVHHAKVGLELLHGAECDVLKRCNPKTKHRIAETVEALVLNTDMKRHKENFEALKALAVDGPLVATSTANDFKLITVLRGLLKIADLGHSWTSTSVHLRWVDCLEEELFAMGDLEKTRGLPISPMCNRQAPELKKSQVGFFDHVLLPLFKEFCIIIPEAAAVERQALVNRGVWEADDLLAQRAQDYSWYSAAIPVIVLGVAFLSFRLIQSRKLGH